jgi:hypothetical protein
MKNAIEIIRDLDFYDQKNSTDSKIYGAFKNGLGSFWPVEYSKNQRGEWYRSVIRDSTPLKTIAGVQKYIAQFRAKREVKN